METYVWGAISLHYLLLLYPDGVCSTWSATSDSTTMSTATTTPLTSSTDSTISTITAKRAATRQLTSSTDSTIYTTTATTATTRPLTSSTDSTISTTEAWTKTSTLTASTGIISSSTEPTPTTTPAQIFTTTPITTPQSSFTLQQSSSTSDMSSSATIGEESTTKTVTCSDKRIQDIETKLLVTTILAAVFGTFSFVLVIILLCIRRGQFRLLFRKCLDSRRGVDRRVIDQAPASRVESHIYQGLDMDTLGQTRYLEEGALYANTGDESMLEDIVYSNIGTQLRTFSR